MAGHASSSQGDSEVGFGASRDRYAAGFTSSPPPRLGASRRQLCFQPSMVQPPIIVHDAGFEGGHSHRGQTTVAF
jgi:hypothetical protein